MDPPHQRGFDNQPPEQISAREATRLLGVKTQTLYSYVSRGWVRSTPAARGNERLYARADVERLKARGQARAGHAAVAAGALRWGEPILSTSISTIRDVGPVYRGHAATDLVRQGATFESVAELLWSGALDLDARGWTGRSPAVAMRSVRGVVTRGRTPLEGLLAVVPRLALLDVDRFAAPSEAEWARARRLIRTLIAVLGERLGPDVPPRAAGEETVAGAMAVALGASPRRARAAIDGALVLLADHELNVSTFAARVVASTGADLYACLTAALAASTGPLHGGASDRVEALLDEVGAPARAREVLQSRASRGDAIPGFGHKLYPEGDPRAVALMETARALSGRSERMATVLAVSDAMAGGGREPPNVDFALVALARALDLPRGAAAALFVMGRTAGWVAHALEQRQAGYLLRPRAEYIGP
jgi:citrate synthase